MYNIGKAEFRRMAEYEGKRCAEIEVSSKASQTPDLLVYVAKAPQGSGYEIVHMYSTNIAPEIDWYNSSLYNAYEEIAEEDFGAFSSGTDAEIQRRLFKEKLLALPGISKKLSENL